MSDSPEVYTDEDGYAQFAEEARAWAEMTLASAYETWVRVDRCTCVAALIGPGGHESGCGWVMVGDV